MAALHALVLFSHSPFQIAQRQTVIQDFDYNVRTYSVQLNWRGKKKEDWRSLGLLTELCSTSVKLT